MRPAGGRLSLAATHLQWAADVSPARADRERRLLIAVLHLMLAEESRGLALRPAVEAAGPSPLRSCVLGTMAFSSGELAEAELRFSEALAQARADPDNQPLAAMIANRLAGTYTLVGDGEKVKTFARWALGTGCLDPAAASQTRTLIAIGASQATGPRDALAELGHLDADPARVGLADVDGLAFRGVFRLLAGDLGQAVSRPHRQPQAGPQGRHHDPRPAGLLLSGAGPVPGRRMGRCTAHLRAGVLGRRHPRPPLRAAAAASGGGLRASRAGAAAAEAERHARLAEEAAASLGYGQERVYAAMARALVCQADG